GNRPLTMESSLPANATPDLSATLSADGKEGTLFAVNDNLEPVTRPLDLSPLSSNITKLSVWTLRDTQDATDPDVVNSFDAPERITPVRSEFRMESARADYRFPALSLTVLKWRIDR